jgi:hypothetical protein
VAASARSRCSWPTRPARTSPRPRARAADRIIDYTATPVTKATVHRLADQGEIAGKTVIVP